MIDTRDREAFGRACWRCNHFFSDAPEPASVRAVVHEFLVWASGVTPLDAALACVDQRCRLPWCPWRRRPRRRGARP